MPLQYINGTQMHYLTSGKGIPIVLIHPPLLTSANFNYQLEQLSDEFQVVAFDIRGHGKSEPSNAPITYELICKDIMELMNYLKIDKAFVCGYSTGGSIALEAMLTYPDRFLGGIMISAISEASDFFLRSRIRMAMALSNWRTANRLLEFCITWGNADNNRTFHNLLKDSKRGNHHNIHEYYKYCLNYNCTNRLSDIQAPVLLLYGKKDNQFKRYCNKLRKWLPNSELVMIPKVKHQLPTKAAPEMNLAIRRWIHQKTAVLR